MRLHHIPFSISLLAMSTSAFADTENMNEPVAITGQTARDHVRAGVAYFAKVKSDRARVEENLGHARAEFAAAIKTIPSFDYEHLPPVYLQAKSWYNAVNYYYQVRFPGKSADEQQWMKEDGIADALPTRPAACYADLHWVKQGFEPNSNLAKASMTPGFGSVLVVYDIADNGKPVNVHVGATAPGNKFGAIAVNTVQQWQLRDAASIPVACRTNLMSKINYAIWPEGRTGSRLTSLDKQS